MPDYRVEILLNLSVILLDCRVGILSSLTAEWDFAEWNFIRLSSRNFAKFDYRVRLEFYLTSEWEFCRDSIESDC